jgi:hypothetical protein
VHHLAVPEEVTDIKEAEMTEEGDEAKAINIITYVVKLLVTHHVLVASVRWQKSSKRKKRR